MGDLSDIVIRTKVDGEWGQYSLSRLIELGRQDSIVKWFIDVCMDTVGLQEGELVTLEHVVKMVSFLERSMIKIYHMKKMGADKSEPSIEVATVDNPSSNQEPVVTGNTSSTLVGIDGPEYSDVKEGK